MTEERVSRLLARAAAPGELDAERRAWAVVRGAYADREVVRERRLPVRSLVALAAALALLAAAFSPPGRAVGGWVRDAIGRERVEGQPGARPALASLPSPGRLLVNSRTGPWVVQPDGSKRRLGPYRHASWSPRGLFVAATRGRQLVALTPTGDVRWTLTRSSRLSSPRWSPSGYRIAYGAGGSLRVVNGDGAPDRLVARGVAHASWSWRPGREHLLAYADRGGSVHLVDVDTRRELWRVPAGGGVRGLAWSADGERLLVLTQDVHRVYDAEGRLVRRLERGANRVAFAAAFAPRGRSFAFTEFSLTTGTSAVVVVDADAGGAGRAIFTGSLRLRDVEWSPDGRWLLVSWPAADQWIFLRGQGVRRIVAVSNVAREFDPAGTEPFEFPRVAGWCCAPYFD